MKVTRNLYSKQRLLKANILIISALSRELNLIFLSWYFASLQSSPSGGSLLLHFQSSVEKFSLVVLIYDGLSSAGVANEREEI